MRLGGCPVCAVRARSERATLDAIINERVLDIAFRAELERTQGLCRRHVAELLPTDRRETGGIARFVDAPVGGDRSAGGRARDRDRVGHLLTDDERTAADQATRALGGSAPQPGAAVGRDGPVSR